MLQPLVLARGAHSGSLIAEVRFLATSTSVRSGYYDSEDIYLAQVEFTRRGESPAFARLVDDYAPSVRPISPDILKSLEPTRLRLRRDKSCDVAYDDMPLRAAPGDPIAILPAKLGYLPKLPEAVQPEQILPCYRIVR